MPEEEKDKWTTLPVSDSPVSHSSDGSLLVDERELFIKSRFPSDPDPDTVFMSLRGLSPEKQQTIIASLKPHVQQQVVQRIVMMREVHKAQEEYKALVERAQKPQGLGARLKKKLFG